MDITDEKYIHEMWQKNKRDVSVYIHNPFCKSICKYCVYNGRLFNESDFEKYYRQYLPEQIKKYASVIDGAKYIYFGGGTASLVPPEMMREIFDLIPNFKSIPNKVFEIHPGVFDPAYIPLLKEYNFNMVIICVQTFVKEDLEKYNRVPYGYDEVKEIFDAFEGMTRMADMMVFTKEDPMLQIARNLNIAANMGFDEITLCLDYMVDPTENDFAIYKSEIGSFLKTHDWKFEKDDLDKIMREIGEMRFIDNNINQDIVPALSELSEMSTKLDNDTSISILGIGSFKNRNDTFSFIEDYFYYIERNVDWEPEYRVLFDRSQHMTNEKMSEYIEAKTGKKIDIQSELTFREGKGIAEYRYQYYYGNIRGENKNELVRQILQEGQRGVNS